MTLKSTVSSYFLVNSLYLSLLDFAPCDRHSFRGEIISQIPPVQPIFPCPTVEVLYMLKEASYEWKSM